MKLTHALRIFFLFLPFHLFAQLIPTDKMVDWTMAGNEANDLQYDTINVLDYNITQDGESPNDLAMENLLADFASTPTLFYFPPGEYFFTKTIGLKEGQILAGESATETKLNFNLGGEGHLIRIFGETTADTLFLTKGIQKDSTIVQVSEIGNFEVGDYFQLISDDEQFITSDWAEFSTGQLVEIKAINGQKVLLNQAAHREFKMENTPRGVRVNPIKWAGVENLHLTRLDATEGHSSHIYINNATNCWVKCVQSERSNFAHVDVRRSNRITIAGNHFFDAFAHGSGGQGYGVVLEFGSSECLVENNTFEHLRHSMLLQAGANGNVLSYNYSIDPFWTDVNLPANSAGDIVLHGNYPYANLFEGNIVQTIVIDDSHGINGPGNTFIRNRAELYGIFMNNSPASPGQIFIGNEITSPFTGLYFLNGEGHFEYGNNVNGSILPNATNDLDIKSFYIDESPSFFTDMEMEHGTIGIPNDLNSAVNPAAYRLDKDWVTACEVEFESPQVSGISTVEKKSPFKIYPNPTRGIINIEMVDNVDLSSFKIKVYSATGMKVLENEATPQIDLSHLSPGIYFIEIENKDLANFSKIIICD